jgi:hypothetical protein
MGWVKQEVINDEKLFESLKKAFPNSATILNGKRKTKSSSVYEYLTDYMRDYYEVTLSQSSRVAKKIAELYEIENFYYRYK